MARAIWSGSVTFGLVSVPVKMYSASSPKTVRFHQLNAKTGARVQQKRMDASTGHEVAFEDIVKGYELTPDRYVMIEPEELDSLAPKQTKTIGIEEFVDLNELDPMLYEKSYYLGATDQGSAKVYRLLADAMEQSGKVGLGRVILRSKEQLAAIRAKDGFLTLSTLLWPDEVLSGDRQVEPFENVLAPTVPELTMAQQLINSLTVDFDHDKFHDGYRAQVLDLIERKAAGEAFEMPEEDDEPAAQPDLMAALQASLDVVAAEQAPKKTTSRKKKAAA